MSDAVSTLHHSGRLHDRLTVSRLMVRMRLWVAEPVRARWRYGRNRRVVNPHGYRC